MVEVTAREKLYRVIFGTDTAAGQRFDIALIYLIVLSVLAIIFDSIESVHNQFGLWLFRSGVDFYAAVHGGVLAADLLFAKAIELYL